nr:aldehyde dehydrogenase family protein [Thermoanaerobaculia bacterium]
NVTGSAGNDTITGDGNANTLSAGAGDTANKADAGKVGAYSLRFDGQDDAVSVAGGDELARRLSAMTGAPLERGRAEVELAVERLFTAAAWADKYAGLVKATPQRNFTFAVNEPLGVIAIVLPDETPLLALCSTVGHALAMGSTTVVVPSERHPLAATDLYQVLETSDVPAGVVNIVTGSRRVLAPVLAAHDDVDGIWYFGDPAGEAEVERLSAGNLKRTLSQHGRARDWWDPRQGEGEQLLRAAVQVKNIWVPWGE